MPIPKPVTVLGVEPAAGCRTSDRSSTRRRTARVLNRMPMTSVPEQTPAWQLPTIEADLSARGQRRTYA